MGMMQGGYGQQMQQPPTGRFSDASNMQWMPTQQQPSQLSQMQMEGDNTFRAAVMPNNYTYPYQGGTTNTPSDYGAPLRERYGITMGTQQPGAPAEAAYSRNNVMAQMGRFGGMCWFGGWPGFGMPNYGMMGMGPMTGFSPFMFPTAGRFAPWGYGGYGGYGQFQPQYPQRSPISIPQSDIVPGYNFGGGPPVQAPSWWSEPPPWYSSRPGGGWRDRDSGDGGGSEDGGDDGGGDE